MNSAAIVGVDLSRWQRGADLSLLPGAGVKFAWIKVSHGLSTARDAATSSSWSACSGILEHGRGCYHWLTDSEPTTQAEIFVRHIERVCGGDADAELFPAIDWEETSSRLRGEAQVQHIVTALRRVRELLGGVVLYSGRWYVEQYVAPDAWIDQAVSRELLDELVSVPYWHAEYPRAQVADRRACGLEPPKLAIPHLPKPWRDRGVTQVVWQFDGNGGCVLPDGVDADFNLSDRDGITSVSFSRSGSAEIEPTPRSGAATPLRAGSGEHTVRTESQGTE